MDVTQDLVVRVTPVNNPGIGKGWYRAYVAGAVGDTQRTLRMAEYRAMRDVEPASVGYGVSSASAKQAIHDALDNFESKFGPLCVASVDDMEMDSLNRSERVPRRSGNPEE